MEHASHDSAVPGPTDILAGRQRGDLEASGPQNWDRLGSSGANGASNEQHGEGIWLKWGVVLIWVGSRSWLTEPLRGSL